MHLSCRWGPALSVNVFVFVKDSYLGIGKVLRTVHHYLIPWSGTCPPDDSCAPCSLYCLSPGPLCIAADNLDLIRLNLSSVF